VTVAGVNAHVAVAAKNHVMQTAQGAFLKIEGGNIMIHGPGKMEFKAGMKELAGPMSTTTSLPRLPQAQAIVSDSLPVFSQQFDLSHLAHNEIAGFSPNACPTGYSMPAAGFCRVALPTRTD